MDGVIRKDVDMPNNTVHDVLLDRRFKKAPIGHMDDGLTEDVRKTYNTMSPRQMRLSLQALDMDGKELAAMFGVSKDTFKNWSAGRTPLPRGIADYLRLRVASKIRAISITTGTPVEIGQDFEETQNPTSIRAGIAVGQIIGNRS